MAYLMQNANPYTSPLFLTSTANIVVQTISWYSDAAAIYALQWGGALACPASVGTCLIGVSFNGVAVSTPSAMQTMTGCFTNFGNCFTSNCMNQASSGLNTLTITAQMNAITAGQAAKIRETYIEVMQTG